MPQIFSPGGTLAIRLALVGIAIAAVALLFVARWSMSGPLDVGAMPVQPIPFSHRHHVGDDGIDCRYCHASVEHSAFAGMPSTTTCLTCHSQLFTDSPLLKPLHDSARTGTPVEWTRVYYLPGFVYFDHSIHVAKGVGCIECHGRVDRMPITRRESPLTMQWCLDCHRDPAPHLRAQDDVFAMVSTASLRKSSTVAQAGAHPVESARRTVAQPVESTRRLTDCSTCHR